MPFRKGISNPFLKRLATAGALRASAACARDSRSLSSRVRRGIQALSLVGSTGGPVRPNASGPFAFNPLPARSAGSASGLNNDPLQRISTYAASLGLSQPLIDWNVYKNTKITERFNLQVRAEIYSVFNGHSFQGREPDLDELWIRCSTQRFHRDPGTCNWGRDSSFDETRAKRPVPREELIATSPAVWLRLRGLCAVRNLLT